jgi:hypothetical protein|tara:strand:- start:664 stop:1113 length:450 start_codon:yes stop_codon:yes gene_type:complete
MFLKSATILTSILFFSSTSLAQTTTSTSGKFALVEKGEKAPFKGTLFDPVATAKIIADKKYQQEKCKVELEYEKAMAKAGCDRDTNYLKYELEIERKKNKLIYNAQKEEIETLRGLAKGSDNTWWATIGFVLGAGMSIAIFYASTEIAK